MYLIPGPQRIPLWLGFISTDYQAFPNISHNMSRKKKIHLNLIGSDILTNWSWSEIGNLIVKSPHFSRSQWRIGVYPFPALLLFYPQDKCIGWRIGVVPTYFAISTTLNGLTFMVTFFFFFFFQNFFTFPSGHSRCGKPRNEKINPSWSVLLFFCAFGLV